MAEPLPGVARARDQHQLTIQTGVGKTDIISISLDDIEIEKQTEVSVMPAGQVNALRRRQEFLDLISYLIALRDGGPEAAKLLQPSAESLHLQIPEYESIRQDFDT